MATKSRRPNPPLIQALFKDADRFEFFQAVRVLEQAARKDSEDPRFEGRAAVGEDADPRREAVRFRALQALSFPDAPIDRLTPGKTDPEGRRPAGPPEMIVSFMGLTGPMGVLPQHYTEMLIRSIRDKSVAIRDFFDLFNHRIISLFVRAWEKYRLPAVYERSGREGDDPISASLYALVGFGTDHLRGRLAVDDEILLHYAGHLTQSTRSAVALEAMLSDHFGRPVWIEQFQGRWGNLAADERTTLPSWAHPEGSFCQLGSNAVIGDRVWDVQGSFRIRVGPLGYREFVRFMPDGKDLGALAHLVRSYVGPDLSFDLQLTLSKAEVPFCRLATDGDDAPRLGWNTWLKQWDHPRDVSDTVFGLDEI
ncbi:type VI secretion system baseplate subunit TssG [Rhodospirillaceae bacterium SYSU D60014]|uniref:type VI secretion system baseplate subunit TssG n=1 Tax=Virgifigura deserti TaxID=2268457 RepID=UPI000E6763D1